MPPPAAINTNPLTSPTKQPGYIEQPDTDYALWKDTAISALAYKWATATPEERNTFLSSTSGFGTAYGMPSATDGVDANGNVYTSPQTLLALTSYIDAGNYGPELLSMVGQPPAKSTSYIESPQQTADRIAQANADRAFQFAQDQAAQDRINDAADRALASQQIAASQANASLAAEASKYGADRSLEGTKYSADRGFQGSALGTLGQYLSSLYTANEANRLGAMEAAGDLGLGLQGLYDARTNQWISLRSDPNDIVAREYTARAMAAPEGYEGPLFSDVPEIQEALSKLLNWQATPTPDLQAAFAQFFGSQLGGGQMPGMPGTGGGGTGGGGSTGSGNGLIDTINNMFGSDIMSRFGGFGGRSAVGSGGADIPNMPGQFDASGTGFGPTMEGVTFGTSGQGGGPGSTNSSYRIMNPLNPQTYDVETPDPNAIWQEGRGWVNPPIAPDATVDVTFEEEPVDTAVVPMVAFGGSDLGAAIVGDPQVGDEPNPELVVGDFDVIPLNRLPKAAWGGSFGNLSNFLNTANQSTTQSTSNQLTQSPTDLINNMFGSDIMDRFDTSWLTNQDQPASSDPATATSATQTPSAPAQVSTGTATAPAPTATTQPASTSITPTSGDIILGREIPYGNDQVATGVTGSQVGGAITPGATPTGSSGNVTLGYPDEAYQNLPSLRFLRGELPETEYNAFPVGNLGGAFGTQLPNIGDLNMSRLYQIMQDPDAFGALSSLYKSANMNLPGIIARLLGRAPIGQGLSSFSMIET